MKSTLEITLMKPVMKLLLVSSLLLTVTACEEAVEVASKHEVEKRPNILLLVADDLGYTDIAPFGSEIPTPNINKLAEHGLQLTRFYTSALCSPSRAMLLSGSDNHLVGLGAMGEFRADNQARLKGYEGSLNREVVTMAEALQSLDYNTYMVGKWHLGSEIDQSPVAQGFDRSFSMIGAGASDHFNAMIGPDQVRQTVLYRENSETIYELPDSFYSTDYFTDRMIDYIEEDRDSGKPFFAFVSYTAPHWPMQAKGKYLDKFKGKYDEGYEVIYARRFEAMKKLGLIPQDQEMPKRPDRIQAWDSLSDIEKQEEARTMEVYAGMIANLDSSVGRFIDYIERMGEIDNTLIVFMSDNGADGFSRTIKNSPLSRWIDSFDNSVENIGKDGSFSLYHPGWAWVGAAPFRLTKGYPTEAGIRSPALIAYPQKTDDGVKNGTVTSIMDLMPTFLEIAGRKTVKDEYINSSSAPLRGHSLAPLGDTPKISVRAEGEVLGMEFLGRRAIIQGDWKLLYITGPGGSNRWELFNLANDLSESNNLAEAMPEKLSEMKDHWAAYMLENNVILPEGPLRLTE